MCGDVLLCDREDGLNEIECEILLHSFRLQQDEWKDETLMVHVIRMMMMILLCVQPPPSNQSIPSPAI